MFKQNGTVLKPITKLTNGKREIDFYESLPDKHPELKEFVPQYFGTKSIEVSGKNVDCIVLEDLTRGFKELCIMDVKIGRRTWDPTATDDKIKNEEVGRCFDGARNLFVAFSVVEEIRGHETGCRHLVMRVFGA